MTNLIDQMKKINKKFRSLDKHITYIYDNFLHSETVERYNHLEERFWALDKQFKEYEEKQRQRIKTLTYLVNSLTLASLKGDLDRINQKMESYK